MFNFLDANMLSVLKALLVLVVIIVILVGTYFLMLRASRDGYFPHKTKD